MPSPDPNGVKTRGMTNSTKNVTAAHQKNQKLISHMSESDMCEIVLLIFFFVFGVEEENRKLRFFIPSGASYEVGQIPFSGKTTKRLHRHHSFRQK